MYSGANNIYWHKATVTDTAGNSVQTIDGLGNVTRYEYDSAGRQIRVAYKFLGDRCRTDRNSGSVRSSRFAIVRRSRPSKVLQTMTRQELVSASSWRDFVRHVPEDDAHVVALMRGCA